MSNTGDCTITQLHILCVIRDGGIDEGFDRDGDGYTVCAGDCNDLKANINPGMRELCDGVDNDCDQEVDEGCLCHSGDTRQCGTDVGRCEFGTQTCSVDGEWGACEGGIPPMVEDCPHNGEDDDCDGKVDEINCDGILTRCDDDTKWNEMHSDEYNYIRMATLGYKCANIWNVNDIDGDGHDESYLIIGQVPFRIWSWCHAGTGKDVSDFNDDGESSYGCTAIEGQVSSKDAGYCDTDSETTYYDRHYDTPTLSIVVPDMFCDVLGHRLGWNSFGLVDDAGDPYMALKCGIDADCPSNEYCYKPPLLNPSAYYCKSRCGNGVCEPGEVCSQDGSGPEICDGADNDCNGVVDDGLAVTCSSDSECLQDGCYSGTYQDWQCTSAGTCDSKCIFTAHVTDGDGDGYDTECDGDCDDGDKNVNPAAVELCDGKDNDCDGMLMASEADNDSDGYMICGGDCDDANPNFNPDAEEICGDGLDNNCNGLTDEGCCTDECQFGEARCNGSYAQSCGNHDSDECLEWPSGTAGTGNEYCGETGHGEWAPEYCAAGEIKRDRIVNERGCSDGSCFSNDINETETLRACGGDADRDCDVDIFDLAAVGLAFGSMPGNSNWDGKSDFDADGDVDIFDLATVGLNYGKNC